MQPINPLPMLIPVAANDLPEAPSAERARLRERERKLRGPIWAAPKQGDQRSA